MRKQSTAFLRGPSVLVPIVAGMLACLYSAAGSGIVTNFTQSALNAVLSGGGTVVFGGNGTITLTNTLLITTNTVLNANGNSVTISGGNAVRLFYVATNVNFSLQGLTLADGQIIGTNGANGDPPLPGQDVRGAGVLSLGGNLILNGCALINHHLLAGDAGTDGLAGSTNIAKGGDALGAAIYSAGGHLNLTNCTFNDNTAIAGTGSIGFSIGNNYGQGGQALGGAIFCENVSGEFQGLTFTNNWAQGGSPGAASPNGGRGGLGAGGVGYISNSIIAIDGCVLSSSGATGGGPTSTFVSFGLPSGDGLGGALFFSDNSTGTVRSTTFQNNFANGGNGGKWYASGAGGGGAMFSAGELSLFGSTFLNDSCTGGSQSGYPRPGQGGAIYSSGQLKMNGCALAGNSAVGGSTTGLGTAAWIPGSGEGGALWSSGSLAATNSTLTANLVRGGDNFSNLGGGPAGPSNGGGICISGGSATLVNLTIAANRADLGTNRAINSAQGGGIFATNAAVIVRNTIIANNPNGGDAWGALIDQGFNLCSDGTAGFSALGSLNQADPMLAALSQNGGLTPTMALLAGSPARDAIPSGFPPIDQRGVNRPQGPAADMGAFEADFISAGAAIVTQPVGAAVRAGTNVTFVVGASGTAPLSYFWVKDGKPLAGGTTSVLSLTNVEAPDAGTYSAIVSNAFGTATSEGAVLSVDSTPLLVTQPSSVVVSPGAATTFSVSADGPALSYQWWHDGAIVSGGTASMLVISNAMAGAQGNYYVVVSNFAGVVTSSAATLSFDASALSILIPPKNVTVEAGYSASFSVVASGIPPIGYLWQHDDKPLAGQTGSTLTLSSVSTNDAGSYSCVVTNGYSTLTSSPAQLTVTPGALPPLLIPGRLGNSFTIDFTAEAGRSYNLLSSADLAVWSSVATNMAILSGTLEFVQPLSSSNLFYRVIAH